MSLVVDAHQDIAYNFFNFGRDYRRSPLLTRRLEAGTVNPQRAGIAMLGLPDAILGRVGVVFGTLLVVPQRYNHPWEQLVYKDAPAAYRLALAQMDYYQRLADEGEQARLIRTGADLDAVLASWGEGTEFQDHRQGLVILMKGADPILEPRQFEEWYERGVRIVAPAWRRTRYAGSASAPGPFTVLGLELLEILAGYNVMLDLAHLSEEAFLQALDHYEGAALIASHSNPRHFHDSAAALSDDLIRALAARDGVVGITLHNAALDRLWSPADPRHVITLTAVVDAIDHVCQLTGSAAHVGIGSSLNSGFGRESAPDELDTVGDLLNIGPALKGRGFDEGDIDAILSGNLLRKLRQSLA